MSLHCFADYWNNKMLIKYVLKIYCFLTITNICFDFVIFFLMLRRSRVAVDFTRCTQFVGYFPIMFSGVLGDTKWIFQKTKFCVARPKSGGYDVTNKIRRTICPKWKIEYMLVFRCSETRLLRTIKLGPIRGWSNWWCSFLYYCGKPKIVLHYLNLQLL